jgi:uncharacterized membrane protein (UPF0127 family)
MACFSLTSRAGRIPAWRGGAWALAACAALGVALLPGCDAASGSNQGQSPPQPQPQPKPPAPPQPGTTPADAAKPDQAQPTTPTTPAPVAKLPTEKVVINGRTFHLEIAADDVTRFRGLSGRTEIAPDGGMLFIFPRPSRLEFVMRDCPVPIDIIFLDGSGRVVATHAMLPEPPRGDGERLNDPRTGTNEAYERRLKKYPSRFDAQFVIELKGGTLETLKLKSADKIDLDVARLKKMAK